MCSLKKSSLVIILLLNNEIFALKKISRQKRCIVIQKQTGGKADSGERADDDDYDYNKGSPPKLTPDRLRSKGDEMKKRDDVESLPRELQTYQLPNKIMYRQMRLKNRLLRSNLY
ncbi:uncharacterized protein LOC111362396 [Spodoptera litura]|uniref:Uncharacterized protein LOC111362396 n=1 Tax=Spodoptera litura TaxID=69820 RepID=A0A9J7J4N3_SPOLT|nr:uncharacterized protein LOC111362396 [Spodoptera litura]